MRELLLADLPITERRLELSGLSTAVLEGGDDPPVILSNRSRTSRDDRFRRKAITPLLRWRVTAWDEER
jgi:hypothetical protein